MRTSMPRHTYAHTHSHLHMYMHACMSTDHPQHTTHTPYTHTPQIHTHIYIHAGMHERARERERARKRERESARDRGRERERTSVHTGFHSSLRMLRQTFPSCMHNNDRQQSRSKRCDIKILHLRFILKTSRERKKEVSPRRCLDGKPTDARKSQFR